MAMRLKSVVVQNFRSIAGTVSIPLDAPIVLLHGDNGVGKTSVLSAIELALTGDIVSMRRIDPSYQKYLLNTGAQIGRVTLSAESSEPSSESTSHVVPGEARITEAGAKGTPLLEPALKGFFSERCYLPQPTLARLLEMYQSTGKGQDSPLTRFAKDLLGLDFLEALIIGLHATGDRRRIRNLLPAYRDNESTRDTHAAMVSRLAKQISDANSEIAKARAIIESSLGTLSQPSNAPLLEQLHDLTRTQTQERETLTSASVEIAVLFKQWQGVQTSTTSSQRKNTEQTAQQAEAAASQWRAGAATALEAAAQDLDALIETRSLPSLQNDPLAFFKAGMAVLEDELARGDARLAEEQVTASLVAELTASVTRRQERIDVIDGQIAALAETSGELAAVLSAVVPHVKGDECPVCRRDYREVSTTPLVGDLSARVAALTEQAGRLQSLSRERAQALGALTLESRQLSDSRARILKPEDSKRLNERVNRLKTLRERMSALEDAARLGSTVLRVQQQSKQELLAFRTVDQDASSLRPLVSDACHRLHIDPPNSAESLDAALDRLRTAVEASQHSLNSRVALREQAEVALDRLNRLNADLERLTTQHDQYLKQLKRAERALESADELRECAKTVLDKATELRASLVRRVFNQTLNSVWRDLFVRLAPEEPFVPGFNLSPDTGPLVAALTTVHKTGISGGNPGTMLSAGNLNTAALTLFLALNLSVEPRLPLLIFDDPVQSMDEVHVTQFAALLRQLSRQLGRQVIVAVHDRPLFEYLILELSPAFEGDRLFSVELSRSGSGETVATPTAHTWKPDAVEAA